MIDQQCGKQHEQIGDGEHEQATSRVPAGPTASAEPERKHDKNCSAGRRGRAIDRACKADRPRQHRSWKQQGAVDQDLALPETAGSMGTPALA